MKKLLKLVALLIVLLVIIGVAAPFVIPAERYKAEITRRVHDATGRDFTISGPMHFHLLPMPGLQMEKVSLANPKGYTATQMLQVESASVQVALMPLFSGQVQVKSLTLDKPVIDLEVNAQGVPNWRFTPLDAVPEYPQRSSQFEIISAAEAATPAAVLQDIQLSDVRISGGVVRYADQRSKRLLTLEDMALRLTMPGLAAPLTLSGDAKLNGQKATLSAEIKTLQLLLSGGMADAKLSLASAPLHLTATGRAGFTGAAMDIAANAPSLPQLAAWTGTAFTWKGKTPLSLDAKGALDCTPQRCILDKANVKLDAMEFTGKLGASWAAAPVYVVAALRSEALDLTPYMAPEEQHAGLFISQAEAADAPSGWSTAPIDLSALRAAGADIKLSLGKLTAGVFKSGATEANVSLKNSVLKLTVPSIALYGGSGKGDLTLDGSSAEPGVDTHVTLLGVQAGPMLRELAQFDRLDGKADFLLHAGGRGASQRDIIAGLSGDGRLSVTDGSFKGVDLSQMAKSAQSFLAGKPLGGGLGDKTDFSELSGSYTITHGLIHNADLLLRAQLLRLRGAGDINLPQRYVKYRLTPTLVGTTQARDGTTKEAPGLGVPIIAEGPLEHVVFRPDVKSAAQQYLKNPKETQRQIKGTVNSLKDQFQQFKKGGGLNNLLNGLGQ